MATRNDTTALKWLCARRADPAPAPLKNGMGRPCWRCARERTRGARPARLAADSRAAAALARTRWRGFSPRRTLSARLQAIARAGRWRPRRRPQGRALRWPCAASRGGRRTGPRSIARRALRRRCAAGPGAAARPAACRAARRAWWRRESPPAAGRSRSETARHAPARAAARHGGSPRRPARSLEYLRLRLRYERLRAAVRRALGYLRLRLRYERLRAAVRRALGYLRLRLRYERLRAAGRRALGYLRLRLRYERLRAAVQRSWPAPGRTAAPAVAPLVSFRGTAFPGRWPRSRPGHRPAPQRWPGLSCWAAPGRPIAVAAPACLPAAGRAPAAPRCWHRPARSRPPGSVADLPCRSARCATGRRRRWPRSAPRRRAGPPQSPAPARAPGRRRSGSTRSRWSVPSVPSAPPAPACRPERRRSARRRC